MKSSRITIMAVAILIAGLLIGGTGGAIAAGKIGTNQIKNGAITNPKLANNAVTTKKIKNSTVVKADLAPSARGATMVQYVVSGALVDTQNTVDITLPGTWTPGNLAANTWSVQMVRNGPPTYVFPLGRASNAGEGPNEGFYLYLDNAGTAHVYINAEGYGLIDTIRVTRIARTGTNNAGTVTRQLRAKEGASGR